MIKVGPDEKIYPLVKVALVVNTPKEAGVPPPELLRGAHVWADAYTSHRLARALDLRRYLLSPARRDGSD